MHRDGPSTSDGSSNSGQRIQSIKNANTKRNCLHTRFFKRFSLRRSELECLREMFLNIFGRLQGDF